MKSQKKRHNHLILEFTEFNLQRYSVSPSTPSIMTPNPQLSQNGFDKHEDQIRQALSKLGDIGRSMLGANSYKYLNGKAKI